MASFEASRAISIVAGEDLTGDLHKFVLINASGKAVLNTVADGPVNGIVGEEVTLDVVMPMIVPDGVRAKVVCGGTITAGDYVGSDATALAKTLGTDHKALALDAVIVGTALESGVVGDVIAIQFGPFVVSSGAS